MHRVNRGSLSIVKQWTQVIPIVRLLANYMDHRILWRHEHQPQPMEKECVLWAPISATKFGASDLAMQSCAQTLQQLRCHQLLHLPLRGAGPAAAEHGARLSDGLPQRRRGLRRAGPRRQAGRCAALAARGALRSVGPADWSLHSRTPDLRPLITGTARLCGHSTLVAGSPQNIDPYR